jgi:4-hydroxy-tetrahydrodipicolinate synthase
VPNPVLRGIVTALVTPFQSDERIDYSAWQVIIDSLIAAGVDGLLAGGSTGEFYTLSFEERIVALRFCRQAAPRLPVFVNVGCITTRETIQLALAAQSEGIDALAVITPYYLQATQDELAEHFIDVCNAVHVPVVAYNFPQHGGAELLPETLGRIAARCPNLAGIKDSGGILEQTLAYRDAVRGRDFAVVVGPERLLLPALANGCAGVVSGCANIAPKLFVDLHRAFQEGKLDDAARLQTLASELSGLVSLHTFPSVIKEAMTLTGRPAGACRRPVSPVPAAVRGQISQLLARLGQQGLLPGSSPLWGGQPDSAKAAIL